MLIGRVPNGLYESGRETAGDEIKKPGRTYLSDSYIHNSIFDHKIPEWLNEAVYKVMPL